ncbi:hypothetical protein PYW07_006027 [Mythimna separata]|uniref:Uncharacterized protein n=1 Tax=Mythimna separata TaxID=271217 RepID=A0AAD8DSH7_MYTSE|nr:hypothetical protein PYW07_006027 [Mythimna separata]
MDRGIYLCCVIAFVIKTTVANFCTIRNDDNCFYTVDCDDPSRINIVPYCNYTDPYITLIINESPVHNVTANLFNTKFDAYVRILTAVGNGWYVVQNNAFSNFKNVLYMDLSDNHIKELDNAFFGLDQLDSLNLSRNFLEELKAEVFLLSELKTKLSMLDLSYNLLTYLPDDFFVYMYNVKKLYLQGNHLTTLGDQNSANLKNLYYLNLCCSNYTRLNITLEYFTNLKELDLSFNKLKNIENYEVKSLKNIILSHNIFNEVVFDEFEQFPNLQELDLSYNKVKKLHSSTNPQNANGTKPMIKLYLNNNNINKLDETFFINFGYIQLLNLSSNGLKNIANGTFKHVKILKVLNLSNTGLNIINNETFLGLENTKIIDISQNNLNELDPRFFMKCNKLETIAADFNNLMTVDINLFMDLVPSLARITLEGNPMTPTMFPVMSKATSSLLQMVLVLIELIKTTCVLLFIILFSLLGIVLLLMYTRARARQRVTYVML